MSVCLTDFTGTFLDGIHIQIKVVLMYKFKISVDLKIIFKCWQITSCWIPSYLAISPWNNFNENTISVCSILEKTCNEWQRWRSTKNEGQCSLSTSSPKQHVLWIQLIIHECCQWRRTVKYISVRHMWGACDVTLATCTADCDCVILARHAFREDEEDILNDPHNLLHSRRLKIHWDKDALKWWIVNILADCMWSSDCDDVTIHSLRQTFQRSYRNVVISVGSMLCVTLHVAK